MPTLAASLTAANTGGKTVSYAGVKIKGNDTSWGAALAAVAAADATIMCLGTDTSVGHEGTDRTDGIGLPSLQADFAAAVVAAARGKPVVALLINHLPVSIDTLVAAGGPPAIVEAFAPGLGGPQVAELLFGGANRWGRMPHTLYPAAYASAVALNDFSMTKPPGRSYRYYSGTPLVRFGDGLSYSLFTVACTGGWSGGGDALIVIACTVTHTSGPAGDQILMVFHRVGADVVSLVNGSHPIPSSRLVAFDRVAVGAGDTVPVSFSLSSVDALPLVNERGARVLYEGLHSFDVADGAGANETVTVRWPAAQTTNGNAALHQPAQARALVVAQPPPLPA